ncbi:Mating-type protein A1 [Ogataea parapolymorpha DL-1]|uniref:Mating-type protein A1 n=1 Tax=Ogataea parapolymorpha (strain ATCC 26012 / BCRC 20466 / JCM 22074 / NRRL Y-7560 / DL-1) TaxID=871575 RepID=W1QBK4_OGAPD|nr:Mating-type protein A1 [Ogataea parapolymorpha DL-1]ESW98387.1 Mating-type protein A1 [Ogataea parapolymorpha DL-1]
MQFIILNEPSLDSQRREGNLASENCVFARDIRKEGVKVLEDSLRSERNALLAIGAGGAVDRVERHYRRLLDGWEAAIMEIRSNDKYESLWRGFAIEKAEVETEMRKVEKQWPGELDVYKECFVSECFDKKKRRHIPESSKELLEKAFKVKRFPNSKERERIARECGISPLQVRVWFTNKRARSKSRA